MLLNSNLRYDSSIGLNMSVTLNGVEWLCSEFCCCRFCKCCKLAKLWLFDDFGDKLITKSTPFKSWRRLCSWGSSAKVPELIASIVDMRFFLVKTLNWSWLTCQQRKFQQITKHARFAIWIAKLFLNSKFGFSFFFFSNTFGNYWIVISVVMIERVLLLNLFTWIQLIACFFL